jgi:hypothetical protein
MAHVERSARALNVQRVSAGGASEASGLFANVLQCIRGLPLREASECVARGREDGDDELARVGAQIRLDRGHASERGVGSRVVVCQRSGRRHDARRRRVDRPVVFRGEREVRGG